MISLAAYKTEYKFLSGIIPEDWEEEYYETHELFGCGVKGLRISDKEWENLFIKIKSKFGSDLIEVFSYISNGVDFIVYIKKGYYIRVMRNKKIDEIIN